MGESSERNKLIVQNGMYVFVQGQGSSCWDICLMLSALSIHSGGRLAVYSCYGTFVAETDMFSNTVFMQA